MLKSLFKENKILLIAVFIVIAFLLFIYVIKPSVIGYILYYKVRSSNYTVEDYGKNIQDLKTQILIYSTHLSACSEFNKNLVLGLENKFNELTECKSNIFFLELNFNLTKNKYEDSINNFENKIEEINKGIEEKNKELDKIKDKKEAEISELRIQHSILAQNTANNLCCKQKIDNPRINYYKIENNKMICLEDGALAISC